MIAHFTICTLQPTQQLLGLQVLAGTVERLKWLDKNVAGSVRTWVSTRWGTKELGPPDPPQRLLGSKGTPRQQRDAGGEG